MAEKKKVETVPVVDSTTKEVAEDNVTVDKAQVKKPRKPREKVRGPEELLAHDIKPAKMTDKEKNALITHLYDKWKAAVLQAEMYKANANSAYEQAREREKTFDDMEKFYRRKLQYVDAQLNAFHSAINETLKTGGIA